MSTADPQSLLKSLISEQFGELLTDVERSRGIVRDAIPAILKAFKDLQIKLGEQTATLEALTTTMGEEGQEGGFLATMRGVVDSFVKDLVTISSQSMRIVERVNDMSADITSVTGNVTNIEEMASTTRFIALNAHIEAHRSGAAGTAFRVVAEEVKHLAGDAQNFSGQIRAAVERVERRLKETHELVAVLASHDLNGALSAQSRLVETVDSIRRTNESLFVTLKVLEQSITGATQALQFEDILNQLLVGIGERASRLRDVWLESLNGEEVAELIEKNRAFFDKHTTVTQSSMNAGTVDLF